jgi:[acyl-carrier-protein] S-malonyltransferase
MGKDLFENYQSARDVFEEADEALGFPLSKLIFEGDQVTLTQTENAQPAILTTSIATLRVLEHEYGFNMEKNAKYAMGHSLGEFSALVATGSLSLSDAVRLVRTRGQAMHDCVVNLNKPISMSALVITKSNLNRVFDVVHQVNAQLKNTETVEVANYNSSFQCVLSGTKEGVNIAARELKRLRIALKAVDLPVSAPFHCSLMKPARQPLEDALNNVNFSVPSVPVVFNVWGKPIHEVTPHADITRVIPQLMIEQVDHPVRWFESVQFVKKQGISNFLSIGPGKVLANLAKKDFPLDWIRSVSNSKECQLEFGAMAQAQSEVLKAATA